MTAARGTDSELPRKRVLTNPTPASELEKALPLLLAPRQYLGLIEEVYRSYRSKQDFSSSPGSINLLSDLQIDKT